MYKEINTEEMTKSHLLYKSYLHKLYNDREP